MRKVAGYAALVLATLAIVAILWQFSGALVMFLLSLAVGAAFRPIIESLSQYGLRKEFALAISFGLVLCGAIGLILIVTGPLVTNLQEAIDDLFVTYERVYNLWLDDGPALSGNLREYIPTTQELYDVVIGDDSTQAIQTIFGVAEGTLEFLSRLVIVIILSLYWSLGQVRFERLWLSLLPVERRAQARNIWQAIEAGAGAYLRREVTLSVLSGVGLWFGYTLLGIDYPILLAFIGALARLIPWLGPGLAALLPLVASSGIGWWANLVAVVYTLLVIILLEKTLGRRFFSQRRYNPLLFMVIVIILGDSYGLGGALLAPILVVAVQILYDKLLLIQTSGTNGAATVTLSGLNEKLEEIKKMASHQNGLHESETENLINRLEKLLEKSRSVGG